MNASPRIHPFLCLATIAAMGFTHAQSSLVWDSSGADPLDPVDGPGIWNLTDALWSNGAVDGVWNNATNDTAVFGNANGAAGTVTLGSAITVGGLTFNAAGSGTYTVTGGTLTLGGSSVTIQTVADAEISSVIAGSAGLVKTGAGRLILSGANTYTGGTTISGGILAFTNGTNKGAASTFSSSGSITLNGGTLQFIGNNNAYNVMQRPLVLTTAGGTLDSSPTGDAYVTVNGAISYSGSGARTLTLTGTLSTGTSSLGSILGDGSGGATSLVKNGTATWNLSRINTYTGATYINQGILRTYGDSADVNILPVASTVYLAAAGTLSLNNDQTLSNLQDGTGGGGIITQAFKGTAGSPATVLLTVESGSFSGQIRDTNANRRIGLAKTTAGVLRLSGNTHSYTGGTTISAGTLLINNTSGSGLGTGAVSVTSATLGGNGYLALGDANTVTVGAGGNLAAGDPGVGGGIGTLTFNGGSTTGAILDMQAGSKFTFNLAAGDINDVIRFYNYAGAADFLRASGGVTLDFTGAQAGVYDLFHFYSNAGTTLTSAGFTEMTSNFSLGGGLAGFTATWNYSTTGIIALELAAIPEASTGALLLGGMGAVLLLRRRRAVH